MKFFETLKNIFVKHVPIKLLALALAVIIAIVIHA